MSNSSQSYVQESVIDMYADLAVRWMYLAFRLLDETNYFSYKRHRELVTKCGLNYSPDSKHFILAEWLKGLAAEDVGVLNQLRGDKRIYSIKDRKLFTEELRGFLKEHDGIVDGFRDSYDQRIDPVLKSYAMVDKDSGKIVGKRNLRYFNELPQLFAISPLK